MVLKLKQLGFRVLGFGFRVWGAETVVLSRFCASKHVLKVDCMHRTMQLCTQCMPDYVDGWMDGCTDGRRDGWIDGRTEGWMVDGWMDACIDGWMDGWIGEWPNG